jgi:hypothetical protein
VQWTLTQYADARHASQAIAGLGRLPDSGVGSQLGTLCERRGVVRRRCPVMARSGRTPDVVADSELGWERPSGPVRS